MKAKEQLGINLPPSKQLALRNALAVLLLSDSTKEAISQLDPKAYEQALEAMKDTFVEVRSFPLNPSEKELNEGIGEFDSGKIHYCPKCKVGVFSCSHD